MGHLGDVASRRTKNGEADRQVWEEAISLFSAAYRGDHLAGQVVLDTATEPRLLTEMLLQLLQVHLMDTDSEAMSKFLSAAASAGPPPPYGARPLPRQRPRSSS